ncbi:MAG TPA: hypothetical protein VI583_00420 [Cyclobacteriaceae bacterium]|nr:hypothetical protein [Cyclobacteriaceae bacterium]
MMVLSCQKESVPPTGFESVVLKNLTGLDDCNLMFQRKNKQYMEASNLNEFIFEVSENDEYWIKYEEDSVHGSYCMVGMVIVLIDLKGPIK